MLMRRSGRDCYSAASGDLFCLAGCPRHNQKHYLVSDTLVDTYAAKHAQDFPVGSSPDLDKCAIAAPDDLDADAQKDESG